MYAMYDSILYVKYVVQGEAVVVGGWSWANDAQLVVAGGSLMLALQQGVVWRWEGRKSTAGTVILAALATTAVSVANL